MVEYTKEQALKDEIQKMLKENEQPTQQATDLVTTEDSSSSEAVTNEEYVAKDEWEQKALKIGWKPDHKGDTFIEAKEYVLRKPLFERIERYKKEVEDLRTITKQTNQHIAQVRKEAYEQAIRDVEVRREVAVSEANTDEFRRLDLQAKQLQQKLQTDPIVNNPIANEVVQLDPELVDFNNRNHNWYNNNTADNAKMVAAAGAVDTFLYKQAQIDQGLRPDQAPSIDKKQHLAAIEGEVKRLFPHKFEISKQAPQNIVQTVGKSTSSKETRVTSFASRLTSQQKELGERFQRDNPAYTLDEYAKDLERMGRLGK